MTPSWWRQESPIGTLTVLATNRGVQQIELGPTAFDVDAVEGCDDEVALELDEYFSGRRRHFDVGLDWQLVGPFGRRVLRVTSEIPYGGVMSYAEVAADAGSPRGFRAAGNALGSNPMPIVVPCHRVLHSGGGLGGYGGGLDRKRWLLELEGALQRRSPASRT